MFKMHFVLDQVNCITGENGSGKSSIMSGVLLALGAPAMTTGRSGNLRCKFSTFCNSKTTVELLKLFLLYPT